jgi:hypothetical protein
MQVCEQVRLAVKTRVRRGLVRQITHGQLVVTPSKPGSASRLAQPDPCIEFKVPRGADGHEGRETVAAYCLNAALWMYYEPWTIIDRTVTLHLSVAADGSVVVRRLAETALGRSLVGWARFARRP